MVSLYKVNLRKSTDIRIVKKIDLNKKKVNLNKYKVNLKKEA